DYYCQVYDSGIVLF
nr:immunoglobulin light chain junction region [Macaca mulatta]MOX18881.1 immunoglobulin light chain junction region [Macaca mulatta]MOX18965.1 immunoglobulin light chain junction region [Macaca mulatta]MOX19650.1 immunoglobulin light chain junction region [Macaca mulatta]MOX20006.1 immunoglobulin light chain junction region [Macaca mulatta]